MNVLIRYHLAYLVVVIVSGDGTLIGSELDRVTSLSKPAKSLAKDIDGSSVNLDTGEFTQSITQQMDDLSRNSESSFTKDRTNDSHLVGGVSRDQLSANQSLTDLSLTNANQSAVTPGNANQTTDSFADKTGYLNISKISQLITSATAAKPGALAKMILTMSSAKPSAGGNHRQATSEEPTQRSYPQSSQLANQKSSRTAGQSSTQRLTSQMQNQSKRQREYFDEMQNQADDNVPYEENDDVITRDVGPRRGPASDMYKDPNLSNISAPPKRVSHAPLSNTEPRRSSNADRQQRKSLDSLRHTNDGMPRERARPNGGNNADLEAPRSAAQGSHNQQLSANFNGSVTQNSAEQIVDNFEESGGLSKCLFPAAQMQSKDAFPNDSQLERNRESYQNISHQKPGQEKNARSSVQGQLSRGHNAGPPRSSLPQAQKEKLTAGKGRLSQGHPATSEGHNAGHTRGSLPQGQKQIATSIKGRPSQAQGHPQSQLVKGHGQKPKSQIQSQSAIPRGRPSVSSRRSLVSDGRSSLGQAHRPSTGQGRHSVGQKNNDQQKMRPPGKPAGKSGISISQISSDDGGSMEKGEFRKETRVGHVKDTSLIVGHEQSLSGEEVAPKIMALKDKLNSIENIRRDTGDRMDISREDAKPSYANNIIGKDKRRAAAHGERNQDIENFDWIGSGAGHPRKSSQDDPSRRKGIQAQNTTLSSLGNNSSAGWNSNRDPFPSKNRPSNDRGSFSKNRQIDNKDSFSQNRQSIDRDPFPQQNRQSNERGSFPRNRQIDNRDSLSQNRQSNNRDPLTQNKLNNDRSPLPQKRQSSDSQDRTLTPSGRPGSESNISDITLTAPEGADISLGFNSERNSEGVQAPVKKTAHRFPPDDFGTRYDLDEILKELGGYEKFKQQQSQFEKEASARLSDIFIPQGEERDVEFNQESLGLTLEDIQDLKEDTGVRSDIKRKDDRNKTDYVYDEKTSNKYTNRNQVESISNSGLPVKSRSPSNKDDFGRDVVPGSGPDDMAWWSPRPSSVHTLTERNNDGHFLKDGPPYNMAPTKNIFVDTNDKMQGGTSAPSSGDSSLTTVTQDSTLSDFQKNETDRVFRQSTAADFIHDPRESIVAASEGDFTRSQNTGDFFRSQSSTPKGRASELHRKPRLSSTPIFARGDVSSKTDDSPSHISPSPKGNTVALPRGVPRTIEEEPLAKKIPASPEKPQHPSTQYPGHPSDKPIPPFQHNFLGPKTSSQLTLLTSQPLQGTHLAQAVLNNLSEPRQPVNPTSVTSTSRTEAHAQQSSADFHHQGPEKRYSQPYSDSFPVRGGDEQNELNHRPPLRPEHAMVTPAAVGKPFLESNTNQQRWAGPPSGMARQPHQAQTVVTPSSMHTLVSTTIGGLSTGPLSDSDVNYRSRLSSADVMADHLGRKLGKDYF